jgi:hypothetical protein
MVLEPVYYPNCSSINVARHRKTALTIRFLGARIAPTSSTFTDFPTGLENRGQTLGLKAEILFVASSSGEIK